MMSSSFACIRTDASEHIGTGHVMRDLVLAIALRRRGFTVEFLCRPMAGDCIEMLKSAGFQVHRLLEDEFGEASDAMEVARILDSSSRSCELLVVDHYGLGAMWESMLNPRVGRILVIDDLANRLHNCNVLLDQNLYRNMEHRYDNLVPPNCKLLLGPGNALLREEFRRIRPTSQVRKSVKRILISLGGSDAGNVTGKVLKAVAMLDGRELVTDVVTGGSNPHPGLVRMQCETLPNADFHFAAGNMAELMASADLAVGAGGISLLERCYLGLPSVTMAIADNQKEQLECIASAGCAIFLGNSNEVNAGQIANALKELITRSDSIRNMSEACFQLMSTNHDEHKLLEAVFETHA